MKDYLGYENARNKQHAALYTNIMRAAFGSERDCAVLIGHHLTFELGGDLNTENEVPSADCLLFDHEVMKRVFGEQALPIMAALSQVPAEERDALALRYFETRHGAINWQNVSDAQVRAVVDEMASYG
jgi:DNA-directed RNA polymerase specialized sigma24 family protein